MSGSTIPAALSALVTVWRAAGLTDVAVIDGPAYDPPPNFLAVGWDRSDQAAVTAVKSDNDMARNRRLETFDVSSLLSFSYDSDEVTTVRNLIFTAFAALDGALKANHTLSVPGIVDAVITDYDFTPVLTEVGTVADLRITVHVQAVK